MFFDKKDMTSDFNMSHEKMPDLMSFSLYGLTWVINPWNFILKVIEILWYFFDKKDKTSDLNMSHEKMTDFVSFLLFGCTLVIKLRKFDFESH